MLSNITIRVLIAIKIVANSTKGVLIPVGSYTDAMGVGFFSWKNGFVVWSGLVSLARVLKSHKS